jgi:hypothetical protein
MCLYGDCSVNRAGLARSRPRGPAGMSRCRGPEGRGRFPLMPTAQRTSAETDLRKLLRELIDLRHEVVEEGNELVATWRPALRRRAFLPSAINLAYYIALRRRDLRAHVPVVWATQVLDSFVLKGSHSRSEMTDAAMAERAECVMLTASRLPVYEGRTGRGRAGRPPSGGVSRDRARDGRDSAR